MESDMRQKCLMNYFEIEKDNLNSVGFACEKSRRRWRRDVGVGIGVCVTVDVGVGVCVGVCVGVGVGISGILILWREDKTVRDGGVGWKKYALTVKKVIRVGKAKP